MRRPFVVCVSAIALLAPLLLVLAAACVGEDPERVDNGNGPDGAVSCTGPNCTNEGGPSPVPFDGSCDGRSFNSEGCGCPRVGEANPCNHGVPGPKSACDTQGTQLCQQHSDGTLRWSACTGGSTPKPRETCHNDVDDDCNGSVDENCTCSTDIDLCRPSVVVADSGAAPATTFSPNAYSMFTLPSAPKANEPFDLYILTKDRPLVGPGIKRTGGGLSDSCYGAGLRKTCASSGAGCAGWKVGFFMGLKEAAGNYVFEVFDPSDPGGCGGALLASMVVVVN